MLHLRRANAEGKRPKCAVCRRVRVAADARTPWDGEALLRSDDVDDALSSIRHPEVWQREVAHVGLECEHLLT